MEPEFAAGPLIGSGSAGVVDSDVAPTPPPQPPAPLSPKDNPAYDITQLLGQPKRNVNITPIRVEKKLSLAQRISKRLTFTWVCVRHTWQLITQNKLNYCLGFFSVFTLVFVIALVQSVLNQVCRFSAVLH